MKYGQMIPIIKMSKLIISGGTWSKIIGGPN